MTHLMCVLCVFIARKRVRCGCVKTCSMQKHRSGVLRKETNRSRTMSPELCRRITSLAIMRRCVICVHARVLLYSERRFVEIRLSDSPHILSTLMVSQNEQRRGVIWRVPVRDLAAATSHPPQHTDSLYQRRRAHSRVSSTCASRRSRRGLGLYS
jgi:hypothetical protein